MDDFANHLLFINSMSQRCGCRLKPELEEALLKRIPAREAGCVQLKTRTRSVGPTHQFYRPEDLDVANIPRLSDYRSKSVLGQKNTKERADG